MKIFSLTIVYSLSFIGLLSVLKQIEFSGDLLDAIIQVPMVAGLIYLVLKLEDKRQASSLVREETHRTVINSLLGVIVELAGMAKPGKISSEDIKELQDYIRKQVVK